jgi:hypothetical protein
VKSLEEISFDGRDRETNEWGPVLRSRRRGLRWVRDGCGHEPGGTETPKKPVQASALELPPGDRAAPPHSTVRPGESGSFTPREMPDGVPLVRRVRGARSSVV